MIVVDTSALLNSLAPIRPNTLLDERLAEDGDLHVPHLVDVELLHALRRLVRREELPLDRADAALADFGLLRLTRYSHTPLMERIWQLRHVSTAYDAAFIALAELLDVPLVTSDRRLAASPGHVATIELFA